MPSINGLLTYDNAESVLRKLKAYLERSEFWLDKFHNKPILTKLRYIGFKEDYAGVSYLCITFDDKEVLKVPVCSPGNLMLQKQHAYLVITDNRVLIDIYDKHKKRVSAWLLSL